MSNFYTGSGSIVQMGKETTFGTAATMTDLVNFTSESFNVSVEKGDEGSLLASKTAMNRDLMSIDVSGDVSFVLRPEFADTLFEAALGKVSEGVYTLCGANEDLPSLTFTVNRKASTKAYTGCVVSSLSLECTAGEYVTGTVNLDGYQEVAGTVNNSITSYTYPSYRCTSATFSVGGSTFDIEGATLSIDNALEVAPQTYSTGYYSGEPQHGVRSVTVDFNIPYTSAIDTFKDTYLTAETNASIILTFSADNSHTVTVEVPNLAITSVDNNVSGTGIIDASISGEALSVGAVEPITITVAGN